MLSKTLVQKHVFMLLIHTDVKVPTFPNSIHKGFEAADPTVMVVRPQTLRGSGGHLCIWPGLGPSDPFAFGNAPDPSWRGQSEHPMALALSLPRWCSETQPGSALPPGAAAGGKRAWCLHHKERDSVSGKAAHNVLEVLGPAVTEANFPQMFQLHEPTNAFLFKPVGVGLLLTGNRKSPDE